MDKATIKKIIQRIIILLSPFLLMILINEYHRIKLPPSTVPNKINTVMFLADECSWDCYENGCKHKKIIKNGVINKIYTKIITFHHSSEKISYEDMNIIFLVILWPIGMYIFLLKCINIQQKINFIKKTNN